MDDVWGYCSSGSNESILCGLWMARKRFSVGTPIITSVDAHFCVSKCADILGMPIQFIDTNKAGCMDMEKLHTVLLKHKQAIVVFTLGTTIKNAYDDIEVFHTHVLPNIECELHIHYDAAFGGAIYPFVCSHWLKYPFDTFNVSLHKYWGCPEPCSIFITFKHIQHALIGIGQYGSNMLYLPNKDFTIACSRNGTIIKKMHEHLVLNPYFVNRNHNHIKNAFALIEYFIHKINKLNIQFSVSKMYLSLSVCLYELPDKLRPVLSKYGLSIRPNTRNDTFDTHIYISKHVTFSLLDEFIADIRN
jgi:glutamate/tyrosine decarboxylase-like PLP-dependent enzyme